MTLSDAYWRQAELVRPDQLSHPITIIGLGGIGSPLTLALAKMGCSKLTLIDPDRVEIHNLPNQLYRSQDVGRPKAEALAGLLRSFDGLEVATLTRSAPPVPRARVVISVVDTMRARTAIWSEGIRYRARPSLYIDARMGGEVGRILAVSPSDPDDVAWYERTLFTDDESDPARCTEQTIVYSVFVLAGLIAAQVRREAVGKAVAREILVDLATLTMTAESAGQWNDDVEVAG
jgi:hypothetical protein